MESLFRQDSYEPVQPEYKKECLQQVEAVFSDFEIPYAKVFEEHNCFSLLFAPQSKPLISGQ